MTVIICIIRDMHNAEISLWHTIIWRFTNFTSFCSFCYI